MYDNYIAVIQAGGKGTRMSVLTKDLIPKPMILLNNKPMLQWQIENTAKYGIKKFIIIVGHLGEKIIDYFGDGKKLGVHIDYIIEEDALGSAGALFYLHKYINKENILLIYGDIMFDISWKKMIAFHEKNKGIATLLIHPNSHPFDSDLIVINEEKRIIDIDFKENPRNYWYSNCVNAGICILNNNILDLFSEAKKLDLEKDILKLLIKKDKVYGYTTPEYVKDAGTPSRFKQVEEDQKNKIWEIKNLDRMQKCIFLDRDGTINVYKGLISSDESFELEKGVSEAICKINRSGYLVIVITNQPVVARGMCDISDVIQIHKKMQVLLGKEGAYLDDIMFCPHHPDKGYPEENKQYKIKCTCRKPATGLLDEAEKKYNIDCNKSFMIGDSTIDIMTGKNKGLKTILLKTGQAGKDGKYNTEADFSAESLLEAINIILTEE